MDWPEALEIVVERTKHERYRALCADDHPDHLAYRARVIAKASGEAPQPISYPGRVIMIKNLFRSAIGLARSGFAFAPKEVRRARLAICKACPFYDPVQKRCRQCGCVNSAKVWISTDKCPKGYWESGLPQ